MVKRAGSGTTRNTLKHTRTKTRGSEQKSYEVRFSFGPKRKDIFHSIFGAVVRK